MKIFIDTANIEEIRAAAELGVIHGITTNPTLISREGRSFREIIKEITSYTDGPVFAEVTPLDAQGMIEEGRELAAIHPQICIKIPMTEEGLKAVKVLSSEGINTNMTLVFSAAQALLAANAGARYVSPFIGRIDDIGYDGINTITDITSVLADGDFPTEVIAASVRSPLHAVQAAEAGADIATIPFKVIKQMILHPLTSAGLDRFMKDWKNAGIE